MRPALLSSFRRATVVAVACGALGCFTEEEGRKPDPTRFYYPTGLVVSPGGTTLYVVNSDFDLQFSGGWVQSLDLGAIRATVSTIPMTIDLQAKAGAINTTIACNTVRIFDPDNPDGALRDNPRQWLHPGPCEPLPLQYFPEFLRAHAFIGAFASGALLVHEPNGSRARLFVPVRGDPSMTYFDVADDRAGVTDFHLDCEVGSDGFCGAAHRLGQDRESTLRGIQLPADPMGTAATSDGVAIVAAHQTQSSASLVVNDWSKDVPELAFFLGDLAAGPTELAPVPKPAFATLLESDPATFAYRPAFLLTYRASAEIDLLRYYDDSGSSPSRPFLIRAAAQLITTNSGGFDSRGVAVIDSERRECESRCAASDANCLVGCAETVPLRIYMANRAPASVLVGRVHTVVNRSGPDTVSGAFEEVEFHDNLPLDFGPSRIEVGSVVGLDGALHERVFIVCFDSRSIFVLDPAFDRIESVIRTGRGPHDIAFDTGVDGGIHSYLLVGQFTDSYIGMVDLDMRRPFTYGQMFATIGQPVPPKESEQEE
jgi:DNA-binding beta-propeller fold protein YncE